MDILQNINPAAVVLGVAGLCLLGVILFFALQILGTTAGIFAGFMHLLMQVVNGGPLAWCGCLFAVGGCMICFLVVIVTSSMLSTCGTANAVNFCAIFGR
jgi:hypothetical protein